MPPRLQRLALGLVCGWLLARLKLAPGSDWLAGPATEAVGALVVRGAALAFVGLALRKVGRDVGIAFLVGVAAAIAIHGLLLGGPIGMPAWDVLAAGVALGLVSAASGADESSDTPVSVRVGERIGLFLAGGGAAVVLEVVARHLRLLGGGLVQDDAAFATTFAVLVALGGACFGWLAGLRRLERSSLPWFVAATAAAGYWSLGTEREVGQILEFGRFLTRYGLDASWHATLGVDALLAGSILVLPAFLLGIALRGARGAGSLTSLLVGAGVGLALLPRILHRDPAAATNVGEIFAAQLLPFGLLTTLLGAGLALLSVPGTVALARWIAFALVLPLGLPVLLVESKPLLILSPWERRPTMPFLAFETPEGLATVEPGDSGLKLATLDRRRLSPGLAGVRAETRALETSFLALPRAVREARAVRVLLVGQLTQVRASELARLGAARVDRTGAWHAAMPRLEGALLEEFVPPPGDVVEPSEARAHFERGDYDLCVVLAVEGDPPRWREIAKTPGNTVVVRWSRTAEPIAKALPGSRFAGEDEHVPLYALAGSGLDDLLLGVLDGAVRPVAGEPGRIELVRLVGAPSSVLPVARLLERKHRREESAASRVAQSLAESVDASDAAASPTAQALVRGLVRFTELQIPSSPFETDEQKVELDDEVLASLREVALAEPPSAFVREAWSWLARVLAGKRDVAALETFVAPVAARWAPWPELEVPLAHADLEALDPAAAVRRLEPFAQASEPRFDVLAILGLARGQSGDLPGAVAAWRRALEVRPDDGWVRRQLAIALVRVGDPAGPEAVRGLLAQNPDDDELRAFLEPGPWPPMVVGPAPEPGAR